MHVRNASYARRGAKKDASGAGAGSNTISRRSRHRGQIMAPFLSLFIYLVLFPRSLRFEGRLAPSIAGLSLHYLLYLTLFLASASRNSISPTSLRRVAIIPFFLIVTVMIVVLFFFQLRRPSSLPLPRTGHTPVILPRFLAAPRFRQRRSMHLSRLYTRRISLGEQDNNSGNRHFLYIYTL